MVDTKVSTIIFVSKKKTTRAVKDRTGGLGIVLTIGQDEIFNATD
jgi:hypothetical protein